MEGRYGCQAAADAGREFAMKHLDNARGFPRLCLIGPMVGRNPGYVTTQGQKLADLFAREGYPVVSASAARNRYLRLVDIVGTLIRSRRHVDLVLLEVYSGRSFVVEDIASALARRLRLPLIMALHGGYMPEIMARHPIWYRRVLARADHLVAPSPFLVRAVERYGFRVEVIPNVIDLAAYPYRLRRSVAPKLFWMRAFLPLYNPEMAIGVVAKLRRTYPDATLVMAGQDGSLRPGVEALAESLGVRGAVRFPGFLDMEGKAREGDAAEIFLNTNRVDNMPVAIIEALAMGLPVVATAVGGVPDLLEQEETGLLVPSEDEEAMVEAVERLLAEPGLAERLSRSGRRVAERCGWEQVRPRWEAAFSRVLGGSPREGKVPV